MTSKHPWLVDEPFGPEAEHTANHLRPRKTSVAALRPTPAALTLKQASEYSGLSRAFFYRLFDKGLLPRLKAGKRVLILINDLDAYLNSIREVVDP